jgi:hypothetical protein
MDTSKSELKRAFELAVSGKYLTVAEIRHRLDAEGYTGSQVTGTSLTEQLKQRMREQAPNADRT